MSSKHIILLTAFISFGLLAFPAGVTVQGAQQIALNFFTLNVPSAGKSTNITVNLKYVRKEPDGTPDFYVFDMAPVPGYVMVAANDVVVPILGYSKEGNFSINFKNCGMNIWLNDVARTIVYARQKNIPAGDKVKKLWAAYAQGINPVTEKSTAVGPLLTTTWNQEPYYNADCPFNSQDNERSVTGCGATAMGQILKYWNYPAQASGGVLSYNCVNTTNNYSYGTVSTDLGGQTYQWSNMPDNLNGNSTQTQIDAVAYLLFQCGVSSEMNYGDDNENGSGSYMNGGFPSEQYGYVNYFGYDNTISYITQASNPSGWVSSLEAELNEGRVIQYEGFDVNGKGGHTWVCDGYDNNGMLHMNWGWGPGYNSYCAVSDLTLGQYDFINNEGALIGIRPLSLPCQAAFSYQVNQGAVVQFTSASTGVTGSTTYRWTFGDGSTSNLQNPAHNYSLPGTYQVCLTIGLNSTNCSSSICDTLTVNEVNSTCPMPDSFQVSGITGDSAVLHWMQVGGADNYIIAYRQEGSNTWAIDTAPISVTFINGVGYYGMDSIILTTLFCGTNYQWKVLNNCGTEQLSNFSAVQSFSIPACLQQPPETPVLSAPGNLSDQCDSTITFSWTAISNAAFYEFELAYDPGFTNIAIDDSAASTFQVGNGMVSVNGLNFPQNAIVFYWRVRAGNKWGWSSFGATNQFSNCTCNNIPPSPWQLGPVTGSDVGDTILFSWTASNCADYYVWTLGYDAQFNSQDTFHLLNNVWGAYFETPPACNTEYYWKVATQSSYGLSANSAVSSFVYTCTTTGVPQTTADAFSVQCYPNPSNGFFHLLLNGLEENKVECEVYDILGRKIMSKTYISNLSIINTDIDLQGIPGGVFTLIARNGKEERTFKLVIN